ncbi:MAG: CDP-alcohol phosphatidyltransferase family protein [Parachlamydiaceae bacterium]|nr:CDP-alcohol phosphatidyltransferase family protein [Parachlamydiaceae bacterium]
MKKIFLLPNVITAFGLSCGLFVIFRMNMAAVGQVTQELLSIISGILLLAALADLLDGAVARIMKAESAFGSIFDSLSDAITFGVAPSVIILKSLSLEHESKMSFLITAAAIIFSVCGILRLARFCVLSQQSKEDEVFADSFKKNFTGLPIPAAAAAVVSMNLLLASKEMQSVSTIAKDYRAEILFLTLLLIGYFMISRWKFPSLKSLHIKVTSFRVVFLTVMVSVALFYGLLYHFVFVFFGFSWLYLAIAWVLSLVRIISGKKITTLEDFEPEPESELEDDS